MQINNSKFERQKLGAERFKIANGIGTLNWVQQFGKTYGTINFIINPHLLNKQSNTIIIVVPSEIIARQWHDNLMSYGVQHHRIVVYTISHILSNDLTELDCSMLIIDEIHRFTTPAAISIIDDTRIKHHYRLGLTGSYPYDNEVVMTMYPIVDKITEEEAIENGWISDFVEYNILISFTERDKLKYIELSQPIHESLELFRDKSKFFNSTLIPDDYSLLDACYRGAKTVNKAGIPVYIQYEHFCNMLALSVGWNQTLDINKPEGERLNTYWNPNAIHERAKKFNQAVQKRNELITNNNSKLEVIGRILQRSQKTTICFNESTAFADTIADYVNALFNGTYPAVCYHSKLTSRTLIDPDSGNYYVYQSGEKKGMPKLFGKTNIKRYVIEFINSGYFKFISTAKALDEGVSIPAIEQVICTGGSTNPITYDQRTARGKTISNTNPDKVTHIFNLVFDDFVNPNNGDAIKSRDKQKLILRQRPHADKVVWVKSVDDIEFDKN